MGHEPWNSDDRDYKNASDDDLARWEEEDDSYRETNSPWNDDEQEGLESNLEHI